MNVSLLIDNPCSVSSNPGSHQPDGRASVIQPEAAGECHGSLQAPTDQGQQAAGRSADCLPEGVPGHLQGIKASLHCV